MYGLWLDLKILKAEYLLQEYLVCKEQAIRSDCLLRSKYWIDKSTDCTVAAVGQYTLKLWPLCDAVTAFFTSFFFFSFSTGNLSRFLRMPLKISLVDDLRLILPLSSRSVSDVGHHDWRELELKTQLQS